jgi:dipeptidyl aminopeptidase/acylaminoacyl peptidase
MDVIAPSRCIAGRDLTEPRLSPDGRWVAFATSGRAGAHLAVVPLDGGPERQVTTQPTPRTGRGLGGGCFDWMPDSSSIVYAAADGELWIQPLTAADPVRLTGHSRSVSSPTVAPDGTWVAYVVDEAEVWVTGLDGSGHRRVDDGSTAFCADPTATPCSSGVGWVGWNPPAMPWDRSSVHVALHDGTGHSVFEPDGCVQQPRFLPDGRGVCVRDDTGWLNVWIDEAPLVDEPFEHAGPSWGPGQRSFAVSPDGTQVAFTRNEGGFGRLCVADVATGHVLDLARAVHGGLDWRADTLVALRTGGRTPTQIVAYDMSDLIVPVRRTLAVGPALGWDGEPALVEPDLVQVTADDGSVVHGRLYASPDAQGRLLCWVHGGPTDQWQVTFMPRIAHWVSRGWSVLVPDHRGSTGHGRAYQQAMAGRWGDLDVADTAALLRWAHVSGIARPDTTVMMGSSAGGLTALSVAAVHPGLVRCAAVAYPVCDIGALDDSTHRFEAHYNDTLIGPRSDPDALAARWHRSPVARAVALAATPLLVLHGDADPVVPIEQSRALVDAVTLAGGDVEFVVYPGEGHGFRQPAHQLDEYARVAAFLDRVVVPHPPVAAAE